MCQTPGRVHCRSLSTHPVTALRAHLHPGDSAVHCWLLHIVTWSGLMSARNKKLPSRGQEAGDCKLLAAALAGLGGRSGAHSRYWHTRHCSLAALLGQKIRANHSMAWLPAPGCTTRGWGVQALAWKTEPLPEASATASSGQRPWARANGTLGCLHEGSCCKLDRRTPLSICLSGGACLLEYQLLQDSICVLLCRPWSVATQRHVCLIVLGLPTLAQSYQSADCAVWFIFKNRIDLPSWSVNCSSEACEMYIKHLQAFLISFWSQCILPLFPHLLLTGPLSTKPPLICCNWHTGAQTVDSLAQTLVSLWKQKLPRQFLCQCVAAKAMWLSKTEYQAVASGIKSAFWNIVLFSLFICNIWFAHEF